MTPLVLLGCGYIGSRIARAALAQGRQVRVSARGTSKLNPLGELGAEIKYLDAAQPKLLTAALAVPEATAIFAMPPVTVMPPGYAMRNVLQAAYGGGARTFIYFSSSGLYGDEPDDDAWIDEDTPIVETDPAMTHVRADEAAIRACDFQRLKTVILRLAPVYGPGRGMRARMRKGDFKILGDGSHATSRIHVDDVVRVVAAAEERAERGSTYLVADDEPTTQGAYAKWLADRMGVPLPPSRSLEEHGKRVPHRNRKIRNARMKAELGVTLQYPSFREGEAAIEAEESVG